jgi:integrase/recombinase XerD
MIRIKVFSLKAWIDAFLRDCQVRDLSPFTIEYYRAQLANFQTFAKSNDVIEVTQVTADLLRMYLLDLEATRHNAGGRHAKYRAVRAFLYWWEREAEPEDWNNPLAKVKPPKVTHEPIDPVPIEDIRAMLATCGDDFTAYRDKAMILCLLDTGARVREFLALNVEDVDLIGGGVVIRRGKGKKPRVVFLGKRSRKGLRAYLKLRTDETPALWVTGPGDRLAVSSLQGMLQRRAKLAGVPSPSPHDFRRACALLMLRAGVDLITLARLMGHTTLEVLRLYLAQTSDDLQAAHAKASPVDRMY